MGEFFLVKMMAFSFMDQRIISIMGWGGGLCIVTGLLLLWRKWMRSADDKK